MSEPRTIDVSGLPTHVFGRRSVTWGATTSFMMIEGTTIGVGLFTYYYLRGNFASWPPPATPLPDLLLPTISMLVLLAVIVPMELARRAALALDPDRVRLMLVIGTIGSAAALALRAFEFAAVNTKWDDHAYGSAVWLVLGLHTSLILVDVFETGVMAAIFYSDRLLAKHLGDAEDAGLYQWFLSLIWVPCWFTLYVFPRLQ